jgi:hypothetical protein
MYPSQLHIPLHSSTQSSPAPHLPSGFALIHASVRILVALYDSSQLHVAFDSSKTAYIAAKNATLKYPTVSHIPLAKPLLVGPLTSTLVIIAIVHPTPCPTPRKNPEATILFHFCSLLSFSVLLVTVDIANIGASTENIHPTIPTRLRPNRFASEPENKFDVAFAIANGTKNIVLSLVVVC